MKPMLAAVSALALLFGACASSASPSESAVAASATATATTARPSPQNSLQPTAPLARTIAPLIAATAGATCDPNYTGACVPPYPPDVNCPQIPAKNFRSIGTDPHRLDADHDGIACES